MSQDRLRVVLLAAATAVRACPEYRESDEVVIILADEESTVLNSTGFSLSTDLAGLLRYHAGKLDQVG